MDYLNEDDFFMVAVSLIEKKQKLLDKNMDNHDVELIQDLDNLIIFIRPNRPY